LLVFRYVLIIRSFKAYRGPHVEFVFDQHVYMYTPKQSTEDVFLFHTQFYEPCQLYGINKCTRRCAKYHTERLGFRCLDNCFNFLSYVVLFLRFKTRSIPKCESVSNTTCSCITFAFGSIGNDFLRNGGEALTSGSHFSST
jgi:hypothetical protein